EPGLGQRLQGWLAALRGADSRPAIKLITAMCPVCHRLAELHRASGVQWVERPPQRHLRPLPDGRHVLTLNSGRAGFLPLLPQPEVRTMRRFILALPTFSLLVLLAGPVTAADQKAGAGKGRHKHDAFAFPKQIQLSTEQQAKLDSLKK